MSKRRSTFLRMAAGVVVPELPEWAPVVAEEADDARVAPELPSPEDAFEWPPVVLALSP
jgi:hypothetical protein